MALPKYIAAVEQATSISHKLAGHRRFPSGILGFGIIHSPVLRYREKFAPFVSRKPIESYRDSLGLQFACSPCSKSRSN